VSSQHAPQHHATILYPLPPSAAYPYSLPPIPYPLVPPCPDNFAGCPPSMHHSTMRLSLTPYPRLALVDWVNSIRHAQQRKHSYEQACRTTQHNQRACKKRLTLQRQMMTAHTRGHLHVAAVPAGMCAAAHAAAVTPACTTATRHWGA
jgi:hypothetical protein